MTNEVGGGELSPAELALNELGLFVMPGLDPGIHAWRVVLDERGDVPTALRRYGGGPSLMDEAYQTTPNFSEWRVERLSASRIGQTQGKIARRQRPVS
jgi:hypothetical protein